MGRGTVVEWKTFALFVLFPPVALLAIVFFPITLAVLGYLYYRGRRQARKERLERRSRERERRRIDTDDATGSRH